MTEGEKLHFYNGVAQGIQLFAWWRDGVQYVGTCGTTLKEALAKLEDGKYDGLLFMQGDTTDDAH